MPDKNLVQRAFRELNEQIAQETDPDNLQEMVRKINSLLDAIERQLKKLKRRNPSSAN